MPDSPERRIENLESKVEELSNVLLTLKIEVMELKQALAGPADPKRLESMQSQLSQVEERMLQFEDFEKQFTNHVGRIDEALSLSKEAVKVSKEKSRGQSAPTQPAPTQQTPIQQKPAARPVPTTQPMPNDEIAKRLEQLKKKVESL